MIVAARSLTGRTYDEYACTKMGRERKSFQVLLEGGERKKVERELLGLRGAELFLYPTRQQRAF